MSPDERLSRDLCVVGELAGEALEVELELDPKPGLVTPHSRGSHSDMDCSTFRASIAALRPYFIDCACLGAAGADFAALQTRGRLAEHAMFAATGGVNTHKGAIFNLGLLVAAAGWQRAQGVGGDVATLGGVVRQRWAPALALAPTSAGPTHGAAVRLQHGIPGAREHAAAGFPLLFDVAVPALQQALARGASQRRACVHALMAIIAVLPDTNLVHRGGPPGLAWAQVASERFLATGSVFTAGWESRLHALAADFVVRWLSPGGAADLLAAAWLVHRLDSVFHASRRRAAVVA